MIQVAREGHLVAWRHTNRSPQAVASILRPAFVDSNLFLELIRGAGYELLSLGCRSQVNGYIVGHRLRELKIMGCQDGSDSQWVRGLGR